ncbi:MAG: hypothetical protein QW130_06835, partial [Sulfolobales archaeon]
PPGRFPCLSINEVVATFEVRRLRVPNISSNLGRVFAGFLILIELHPHMRHLRCLQVFLSTPTMKNMEPENSCVRH